MKQIEREIQNRTEKRVNVTNRSSPCNHKAQQTIQTSQTLKCTSHLRRLFRGKFPYATQAIICAIYRRNIIDISKKYRKSKARYSTVIACITYAQHCTKDHLLYI